MVEAMLLDDHATNPLARKAARKMRDAGVPTSIISQLFH